MICDFKTWLKIYKEEDGLVGAEVIRKFTHNQNKDYAEDFGKIHQEVSKLVYSKYNFEYMRFLKELAEKNSDRELGMLLAKLNREPLDYDDMTTKNSHEEIVPPLADQGGGVSEFDN